MAVNQGAESQNNGDTDVRSKRLMDKIKDPATRNRLKYWIWLAVCMGTLGIANSMGGPTFPDIQIITDTSKDTASFFITSFAGGYLVGSLLSGFIHSKIENIKVVSVLTLAGGGATIASPYCSTFVAMLIIKFVCGTFLGGIDTTMNAEHMRLWGNEGRSLLQFMHFSYAVGGVVGPLLAGPFLSEKQTDNATSKADTDTYNGSEFFNDTNSQTQMRHTNVHYAFWIAGGLLILASVPFLCMICMNKKSTRVDEEEKYTQEIPDRKLPTSMHLTVVAMIVSFYIFYFCVEITFNVFLLTFLTEQYKEVTSSDAAYITTYYWTAFAGGRFASIFTSKVLTGVRLLYIHISLILAAYLGFFVSAFYGRSDLITGFTCLAGLAMSAVFPAGLSWVEKEIVMVTGRLSGAVLVGSSMGMMVTPIIVGHLMETESNMWFPYIMLGATVILICIFISLLMFNRLFLDRKYGILKGSKTSEVQVVPEKVGTCTNL